MTPTPRLLESFPRGPDLVLEGGGAGKDSPLATLGISKAANVCPRKKRVVVNVLLMCC